jgi:hypothetical protein
MNGSPWMPVDDVSYRYHKSREYQTPTKNLEEGKRVRWVLRLQRAQCLNIKIPNDLLDHFAGNDNLLEALFLLPLGTSLGVYLVDIPPYRNLPTSRHRSTSDGKSPLRRNQERRKANEQKRNNWLHQHCRSMFRRLSLDMCPLQPLLLRCNQCTGSDGRESLDKWHKDILAGGVQSFLTLCMVCSGKAMFKAPIFSACSHAVVMSLCRCWWKYVPL